MDVNQRWATEAGTLQQYQDLSIFTGNHFGSGEALENAIGLVARDVADYFSYRP